MDSALIARNNSIYKIGERRQKKILKKMKRYQQKIETQQKMKKLVSIRNQYTSHSFYSSQEWLRLRYRVLSKRGKRCECCGNDGLHLKFHVDHIKPRSRYPELQLLESNLQILCEPCNLGKGNWDETDWRVETKSTQC